MDTVELVGGPELRAIASLWVAQKRELVVAFGGTSMLPTIAPGQKVVLRCGVTPAIGDVAAFILGDQLAVHRVVAQGNRDRWVMTWGDANPFPDNPVDDPALLVGSISQLESHGAMQPVPSRQFPLVRRVILRFVLGRRSGLAGIRRRVAFLYRIRSNVALGPLGLARKVARKLF